MTCPACGTENREGRRFCSRCGAALEVACPSCGAANDPEDAFCGACGTPLGAATAAAAPPPRPGAAGPATAGPAAERRLVSVLFADLVGFTTLSETRDSEEVRELLSRYFDTCKRLIELYGGTVEKFIGDAVMAVWGTPVATEDDAERAVRAALDLVAAVSALGDEVGAPELRARAGVLTGEAAVTLGASDQGMIAGDIVNTASRVQSAAEPGTVYVGESTRRTTEQTIVFEDMGLFELKGKEGLTPLWKALRVVSGVRGTLKSTGLEAPFVGRGRELRQIKDLFHTSADERKAHLVSVTGIAGIGKSRLSWEFYKYFDGITQTVYWHRGRCLAYGEGVAYWALADMVRMRCRIVEDEDAASARKKLRATLEEHLLDAEERAFVEPRLGQLLGLGDHEGRDRQDLFAAWRLFFERLADVYPTVLAFEDMQWADSSLLDFVEHLLEWSRNHPLYVITLARPELLERRPTWGAGHRNFSSIYLEPLPAPAMEELLGGLVPGLPATLRDQILARAEGVPLYAVETVRMLLDRGALVQEGSVYRPVGEIESLEVPETLHALIAARLDGLSPEEKRLLQDGAVLGKTFTQEGVASLSGRSEPEIGPLLGALVRKEVLSLQTDPRSPEHGQYGFLQDLVRHVAYETLSKRERRTRHIAAAAYLAVSISEDEVAEVVASHYVAAYEAAPDADDAPELREKAREALSRAGERAASLAAAAEAQRYFEQAAELTDVSPEQAGLLDRAGQMAWRANEPGKARALLERAYALYDADGDRLHAARVSARIGELDATEGHLQQAVARLEPALETLSDEVPDENVAAVAAQLGRFLILSGESEKGAAQLEHALTLAEALDLPETLAQALTSKSLLYLRQDRLNEARILLEGALAIALWHDLHSAALRAYNNLLVTLDASDRIAESFALIEQAIEFARRVGDRGAEAIFVAGSTLSLYLVGRWEEALARAMEAAETASTVFAQSNLLDVVYLHCDRGGHETARQVLERFAAVGESDNTELIASYAVCEARVLRAEGRPREALERANQALAAREEFGTASWTTKLAITETLESSIALGNAARTLELLGILDVLRPGELTPWFRGVRARFHGLLAATAGGADAGAHFQEAERVYEGLGTPFFLAVTQLEHAEWLATQGEPADAAALQSAARSVFDRLGAVPWLERADRQGVGTEVSS